MPFLQTIVWWIFAAAKGDVSAKADGVCDQFHHAMRWKFHAENSKLHWECHRNENTKKLFRSSLKTPILPSHIVFFSECIRQQYSNVRTNMRMIYYTDKLLN